MPSAAPDTSLPRGAACLPCRRRKMRCDGGRPVCTQCISREQPEDCEYTGPQALTRTQVLEENIAILEARIHLLENPEDPSSSVRLHAPGTVGPQLHPVGTGGHIAPQPCASTVPQNNGVTLTVEETHALVTTFLPYASQLGFFLNVPRFLRYVRDTHQGPNQQQQQQLHTGSLLNILLNAVCLWGSRLSTNPSISGRQEQLLNHAVKRITDSFVVINTAGGVQTHDILALVQAEVLIANYFFTNNRLLEGRYHGSAAISLALSCKLNLRESIQALGQDVRGGVARLSGTSLLPNLPPPEDLVQVGERVNAFWTVQSMHKVWSIALESTATGWAGEGSFGAQIEIPWPLSMEACEKGQISPSDTAAHGIVHNFLMGGEANALVGLPPLSLQARAAVLFTHAGRLASKLSEELAVPGVHLEETLLEQFHSLHNSVTGFLNELVALEAIRPLRLLLVTSMLTRAALIRLHEKFAKTDNRSRDICMNAAAGTTGLLVQIQVNELRYIDPILAVLLATIGQVYPAEIARYKSTVMGAPNADDLAYIRNCTTSAQQLVAIMFEFGVVCPLIVSQASQLRNALTAA